MPRCHASQLTSAYTGLNAAMGGVRGMIAHPHQPLRHHLPCVRLPRAGLLRQASGFPLATHLTSIKAPHATVVLRPGNSAQAMLTWRVNVEGSTPFSPSVAHVTPPDEYAYLSTNWQGGPVLGGNITAWPLRTAPAGPFPA